jgi:hypothetical protein
MTESGNPRENAIAERINGILKTKERRLLTPAFVHQTGVKMERKRKKYYRSASKPEEELRPIKVVMNCKGIARQRQRQRQRQNDQVYVGKRTKNCKEILGPVR